MEQFEVGEEETTRKEQVCVWKSLIFSFIQLVCHHHYTEKDAVQTLPIKTWQKKQTGGKENTNVRHLWKCRKNIKVNLYLSSFLFCFFHYIFNLQSATSRQTHTHTLICSSQSSSASMFKCDLAGIEGSIFCLQLDFNASIKKKKEGGLVLASF